MLSEIRSSNTKLQEKILYFEELREFINIFAKDKASAGKVEKNPNSKESNKENRVSHFSGNGSSLAANQKVTFLIFLIYSFQKLRL